MKRFFDSEVIRSQIENLAAERSRIDEAIAALESALRNMEGIAGQAELRIDLKESDITLQDAVKGVCLRMVDAITRQRVLAAVQRERPFLKPKSSSVAAAILGLVKGENPTLHLAIEGKGRTPSVYSTQGTIKFRLSADEREALCDAGAVKGTGGWQSLWQSLLHGFDKSSGVITLTPEQRAKLYQYYHSYGGGGWQTKAVRVFKRELPHLFTS